MTSAIETEGLAKSFGETRALGGIDMVAREGTVFGLLGPNGAGKTTTIRVLSTLLRPDEGRAAVGGYDVVRNPEKVRRLIGLTGQYAAVDELLSGNENLFMIGRLLGLRAGEARSDFGRQAFDDVIGVIVRQCLVAKLCDLRRDGLGDCGNGGCQQERGENCYSHGTAPN